MPPASSWSRPTRSRRAGRLGRSASLLALAAAVGTLLALTAAGTAISVARHAGATGSGPVADAGASPATHAEYAAGLTSSREALAWIAAADRALDHGVFVEPPFAEHGRFPARTADALGYIVPLRAGERLRVELRTDDASGPIFLDLFDVTGAAAGHGPTPAKPLAARAGPGVLEYQADRDRDAIVRLQPALGAGASYALVISRSAALVFPVAGADVGAIIGHFFDERDGGARRHRAVDIAAPHGSPVLAAAAGEILRVEETEVGGRVIWLRESDSGREQYYAHLHEQLAVPGKVVDAGDTIGTVGVTGNARGETPHLHFAVWQDGVPVNPLRLLRDAASPPQPSSTDAPYDAPSLWRTSARTRVDGAALRGSARDGPGPGRALARATEVLVLASAAGRYRVRLQDGREGFMAGWLLEPLPGAGPGKRDGVGGGHGGAEPDRRLR